MGKNIFNDLMTDCVKINDVLRNTYNLQVYIDEQEEAFITCGITDTYTFSTREIDDVYDYLELYSNVRYALENRIEMNNFPYAVFQLRLYYTYFVLRCMAAGGKYNSNLLY